MPIKIIVELLDTQQYAHHNNETYNENVLLSNWTRKVGTIKPRGRRPELILSCQFFESNCC
jgi:hypothetical protein